MVVPGRDPGKVLGQQLQVRVRTVLTDMLAPDGGKLDGQRAWPWRVR